MAYEKYGHPKRDEAKHDEAKPEHDEDDEPVVTHPSSEHGTPRDVEDQPTLEQRVEAVEKRVDELEKPSVRASVGKHDSHALSPEQVAHVEQLIADHLQRTIGHSGEPAYGETVTDESSK